MQVIQHKKASESTLQLMTGDQTENPTSEHLTDSEFGDGIESGSSDMSREERVEPEGLAAHIRCNPSLDVVTIIGGRAQAVGNPYNHYTPGKKEDSSIINWQANKPSMMRLQSESQEESNNLFTYNGDGSGLVSIENYNANKVEMSPT